MCVVKNLLVAGVLVGVASFATDAGAFQIESPVSSPCHESITYRAETTTGFPDHHVSPAPTEDQRRAMNDLVFGLVDRDVWSLALFIGVRSNDLKDNAPTDLQGLIHVHDDPAEQDVHCIRRQEDDGTAGDIGALAACRAFIVAELEAGGLLEDTVDLQQTEPVSTYFKFRGKYTIALPRFAYHLGRAAHAIQDSYAHSMRDADTGHVVSVLNWVDAFGQNNYNQDSDGYPHLSALDNCIDVNEHQRKRIEHATNATTQVFAAIASAGPGRRERVLRAVDAALVLKPGCDPTNNYCNAPELDEPKDLRTFGCSASGVSSAFLVVAVAGLGIAIRRRRRAGQLAAGLLVLGLWSTPSRADDPPPPVEVPTAPPAPAPDASQPAPDPTGPQAAALVKADASSVWYTNHWHFDARFGASIDNPAAGVMVGVARTQAHWTVGFLAEWNPWFSFDRSAVRAGVFDAYFTLSYRWFQGTRLSISTRIEAGTSTMLFDVLGINKFTTGIYVGGALTTIRFPFTHRVAVTFDPVHFAMPTPRPFGLPFYNKQYRVTLGLEVRI